MPGWSLSTTRQKSPFPAWPTLSEGFSCLSFTDANCPLPCLDLFYTHPWPVVDRQADE